MSMLIKRPPRLMRHLSPERPALLRGRAPHPGAFLKGLALKDLALRGLAPRGLVFLRRVLARRMPAKRVLDLTAGLTLLLLLLPLLLVMAVALAGPSRGAVLVRRRRIGLAGRPFGMLAFRTSPRSRLGRLVRGHFLDELPQLINVVLGSMSLVGPRPLAPGESGPADGAYRARLRVRPGITGLWQISGRSDMPWEDMSVLDLHYVEQHWLGLDLAIMARTLPAVFAGRRPPRLVRVA